jgi:APA family basic amino acid/polyamine antiporter
VHPHTGTPLIATAFVVVSVIPLALLVPLTALAEITALATLVVFALVNLALLRLRYLRTVSRVPHITVPVWVPAIGLVTCAAMIASALLK